mgnify:CR=1 FL=1
MSAKQEKPSVPVGYVRANQHTLPENGETFFNFTQWNGKEWIAYEPADTEEWESLITGKMSHSTGQVINLND